jgi:hypothetical protein
MMDEQVPDPIAAAREQAAAFSAARKERLDEIAARLEAGRAAADAEAGRQG